MRIFYPALLLLALPLSAICSDAQDAETGKALAEALSGHMITTYSCQKYLGGLNQYRIAKLDAIETSARVWGDRNKAVLTVDGIAQKLTSSNAVQRMETMFNETKLPELQRIGTCQDLIAESSDQVQVLKAKAGLL